MTLNKPVVGIAAEAVQARTILADSTGAPIGIVTLAQKADGVHVHVSANGLTPGFHGFHIHDIGTCTAPAFTSAGGHYNPLGAGHGAHAGDNPVVLAPADGSADQTFVTKSYTVSELLGADNYGDIPAARYRYDADNDGPSIGDPIGPDPLTTGKTGDAGAREVCGPVKATGGSTRPGYWLARRTAACSAMATPATWAAWAVSR